MMADIHSKETHLTKREKEILNLIASGRTNAEIADTLNVSPQTVKTHIRNLYRKIGVQGRLQAVLYAVNSMLKP